MIRQDSDNRNSVPSEYSALWQRIQAFSLDQAGSELPFSRRVARENGWSTDYTRRVIEEYKRFTLLATVASRPVTPSDPVDQVWHLHLTYSRSYWEDFCPHVLGKAYIMSPRGEDGPNDRDSRSGISKRLTATSGCWGTRRLRTFGLRRRSGSAGLRISCGLTGPATG